MLALRAPGQEGTFFSTCSSRAGTRAALFIFLWLEIKEFIGFILKSESFKNKSKASRGLCFPLKEQSTETKCAAQGMTSLLDSSYQAGLKAGFLSGSTSLHFFPPPLAVCGCVCIAWTEFINMGKKADKTKFQTLFLAKTSVPCHQESWHSHLNFNIMLDGTHSKCCIIIQ